jgi:hypothetical protein
MMKVLLASASALAFLTLAACDGGDSAPPAGGGAMDQMEPMDTAPQQPSEPAQ